MVARRGHDDDAAVGERLDGLSQHQGRLVVVVAAPKEILSTDTPASAKAAILVATSHDDPQMLYALRTWPTIRSALGALDHDHSRR